MTSASGLTCTARPTLERFQAQVVEVGVAPNQLRCGPKRPDAGAGPTPRAGARSFPTFRFLGQGAMRITRASATADKGTST